MFLFTGTRELMKGMIPIFEAVGHLIGVPIREKHHHRIKLPRYRRSTFNREFRERMDKVLDDMLAAVGKK